MGMRTPGRETACWLGLVLVAGGLATAQPAPVAACVLALTALVGARALSDRSARPGWLVVLGVLAPTVGLVGVVGTVGFVRARGKVERYENARAPFGSWAGPRRCELRGVVVTSPVALGTSLRLGVELEALRCEGGPDAIAIPHGRGGLRAMLYVPTDEGTPALARGDAVEGIASLAAPYRFWNEDLGDPRPSSARRLTVLSGGVDDLVVRRPGRGPLAMVDRARARIRARIKATFPADTEPMARALVLGEDDLDAADQHAFRRSGLAHLLAVSGMHLVLVVVGFVRAIRGVLARIVALAGRTDVTRLASLAGLPIAWLYADLAGASGSAIRAAWMCSVGLLARVLGRRAEPWRALGLSVVAMALCDPLVGFDVSFVLSALATGGILGLSRPIARLLGARAATPEEPAPLARRVWRHIAQALAASAAATIVCAPILAGIAPELPVVGLVANLVAVPLGEAAALPLCLVHVLLAPLPAAEHGCALAASGALALVRAVARRAAWGALPVPPPSAAQLALLVVLAGILVLWRGRARRLGTLTALALLAGAEVLARGAGQPRGVLRVTFLDVGQGDAALVDLPDGSALLVDGGGLVGSPIDVGERVIAPVLAARRRTVLAAVVLSHPHPDHFLGLPGAVARAPPRAFWDTVDEGVFEGPGHAEVVRAMTHAGAQLEGPSTLCGERRLGGALVEVLAPCPARSPDRGANDNSFVVRLGYGRRSILLVGDAEREEEGDLVRRAAGRLHADVLKVGHHGSRTSSSSALLAEVRPAVAVVSCGGRNRFGHPHAEAWARLVASGAQLFRTDRDGGVVVTTDGMALSVRSARPRR